jgi:predicted small metal-binding protein
MNCDFEATGATDDDVLQQAVVHARSVHQISDLPPELAARVRGVIRTE